MRSDCPDCGHELHPIQVMDRGYMDATHKGLLYAEPEKKKSFFSMSSTDGTIQAWMCKSCQRVLFCAVPKK